MGVIVNHYNGKISVSKGKLPKLSKLIEKELGYVGDNIKDMLSEIGFDCEIDSKGSLSKVELIADKSAEEEELIELLLPFSKKGSFIELVYESDSCSEDEIFVSRWESLDGEPFRTDFIVKVVGESEVERTEIEPSSEDTNSLDYVPNTESDIEFSTLLSLSGFGDHDRGYKVEGYAGEIKEYCARKGYKVVPALSKKRAFHCAVIKLEENPPKCIALTFNTHMQLMHYLNENVYVSEPTNGMYQVELYNARTGKSYLINSDKSLVCVA